MPRYTIEFTPTTVSAGGDTSMITPAKKPANAPWIGPIANATATTDTTSRSGVAPGNPKRLSNVTWIKKEINNTPPMTIPWRTIITAAFQ